MITSLLVIFSSAVLHRESVTLSLSFIVSPKCPVSGTSENAIELGGVPLPDARRALVMLLYSCHVVTVTPLANATTQLSTVPA